jgi:TonB family protein
MENTMRHLRPRLVTASFLAVLTFPGFAAEVEVVANPAVKADSISVGELRSVFLAESNRLRDGSHVEPVFEREGAVHEAFVKDFLKQTNASLHSHYGELVFTGKASMPKSFSSDAEVVAYVASTRGAIGYVDASANIDGVKVLEVTFEGSKSERKLINRIEPEYPDTLLQMHIGGTVRLKVIISPQGRVEDAELLGGNPILGEAAIKAIKRWIYAPAPSTTTLQVTIPFDASR